VALKGSPVAGHEAAGHSFLIASFFYLGLRARHGHRPFCDSLPLDDAVPWRQRDLAARLDHETVFARYRVITELDPSGDR
jgi:hypothetical protein